MSAAHTISGSTFQTRTFETSTTTSTEEKVKSVSNTAENEKWTNKKRLNKSLHEARFRPATAQKRYKQIFDTTLRKQRENIEVDDHVHLHVKHRDKNGHHYKLEALATWPYPALGIKKKVS